MCMWRLSEGVETGRITLSCGMALVGQAGIPSQWLVWFFWVFWLTLLFTSIALFWLGRRRLALVGFIVTLLLGALALMPVVNEN